MGLFSRSKTSKRSKKNKDKLSSNKKTTQQILDEYDEPIGPRIAAQNALITVPKEELNKKEEEDQ